MQTSGEKTFSKTVDINTSPEKLWKVLSEPDLMKRWVSDSEVEILTDWKLGSPITMLVHANSYKDYFENKGTVLQFKPEHILQYSHLSALSRLPDLIENYTVITFTLIPGNDKTSLNLTLSNFPTETIYQHLAFYWNITLELIKKRIENEKPCCYGT